MRNFTPKKFVRDFINFTNIKNLLIVFCIGVLVTHNNYIKALIYSGAYIFIGLIIWIVLEFKEVNKNKLNKNEKQTL